MASLTAVGGRAFVAALTGIGAEPIRAETTEEFAETLKALAIRKDVHLVFVAEPTAASVPEAVAAFRRRSHAALLALPLTPGGDHPSLATMRRLVEQATGASLI